MAERDFSVEHLASALQTPVAEAEALLIGDARINADRAARLSAALGASTRFWLTREAEYVEDQIRVMAAEWSSSLPLRQMRNFGWIDRTSGWREEIDECLQFFGVEDFEEWQNRYCSQFAGAHFRKSPTYANEENATLVWFRAGERAAASLATTSDFSPSGLRARLGELRNLTRLADPAKFIPALQSVCSQAGLAVVVVPAPDGCRASGATRWIHGRPLVQLSARHLSDDHLWYTFFHELGHVLCHADLDETFIDGDADESGDAVEAEADEFATLALFGEFPQLENEQPIQYRDVIRAAKRLGVSAGILIGQLQHRNVIPHERFNRLKRRYQWNGTSLVEK
ncbi:ImmA/IrrE family metallo-endopeptidase [Sanguibacter sp. 25GB23B1]|uniref:ImmA/IrrE family metallo-endopeptidase n=1 Tax=unclassified Sanguibacter TaxID=2645534 RepID=UPI0032AF6B7C